MRNRSSLGEAGPPFVCLNKFPSQNFKEGHRPSTEQATPSIRTLHIRCHKHQVIIVGKRPIKMPLEEDFLANENQWRTRPHQVPAYINGKPIARATLTQICIANSPEHRACSRVSTFLVLQQLHLEAKCTPQFCTPQCNPFHQLLQQLEIPTRITPTLLNLKQQIYNSGSM